MQQKDYRAEIHAIFEKMRSTITVDNKLSILRLELLEKMENSAIEENKKETIKRLKANMRKNKQKTYNLPYANKKITILPSGRIKQENLK